jgi:hypothetical protein
LRVSTRFINQKQKGKCKMSDYVKGRRYKIIEQTRKKDPNMPMALNMAGMVTADNVHEFANGIPFLPPWKAKEGDIITYKDVDAEGDAVFTTREGEEITIFDGNVTLKPVHLEEV